MNEELVKRLLKIENVFHSDENLMPLNELVERANNHIRNLSDDEILQVIKNQEMYMSQYPSFKYIEITLNKRVKSIEKKVIK
jgi:uncharacterized protein YjgD (DUF1641 family)